MYAIGGTLGAYQGDIVWGGAVMFERADLDMDSFLRDLRRTVSDDGILTEYLDVTPLRRTRIVPMGGSLQELTLPRTTAREPLRVLRDTASLFSSALLTAVRQYVQLVLIRRRECSGTGSGPT